ncbi:hypothetical protein HA402_010945 [Bradysia odoriphaga]|nr:hypothetical protein HA402_010945 [Bradysia odoriphaga]
MRSIIFLLATLVALTSAEQFSYEGYKVYKVTPRNENQGTLLLLWEDSGSIDLWEPISKKGKSSRIMVAPDNHERFVAFLRKNHIEHELIIENVERSFERERAEKAANEIRLAKLESEGRPRYADFYWFWTYSEINRYITFLTMNFGDICEAETLGWSGEGRAIRALKIGRFDGTRPLVFLEAGIHAREWIAPMTAVYVLQQLVENSASHNLLDELDFIIIPVTNPDGYEYSHAYQRLWRKTRSPIANSTCIGVDGNRNFAYQWRYSANACGDTYAGPEPFSERETSIVRDVIAEYGDRIKLYGAIHSYGQYFLYPWGFEPSLIENWEDHDVAGNRFADAIFAVNGTRYTVGNGAIELYPAFGASDDYAAEQGVDISTTIELPGGGNYGFDLPAERIYSVVEETWEGMLELFAFIAENYSVD